ncbi:MAG: nidogen-like domain-containing protein [Polyangiales bacterium]
MPYRLSSAGRASLLALSLSCVLGGGVANAIPLLNGFGGPTGYGLPENCVHPNDDGSYSGQPPTAPRAIDIRRAFPDGIDFFGNRYTSMYVNTNGNITFRAALPTYTPAPFPVAQQPMIAPFWGDVDTRGGGQPSRNNICFHVEPNRVVVTWHLVGYYSSHDNLQNSFQLVLTRSNTCTTSGDFDVEFRYARCTWTTGDASGGTGGFGGTPAQIGFDAGDSRNYVALPMSRTMQILQVCGTSNIPGGEPGLWRFQIRGGGNDIFGCAQGGERCVVEGQRGICAQGVRVCTGMGTTCRQVNMPRARACNGLDNDCDGMPDTDDSLCGTGQICELGACVDRCQSELGCPTGRECTPRGACVEAACLNMTCPAEQVCRGGQCVAVCDGITCPYARFCRAGRCIDPCAEITCGAQEVCEVDARSAVGRCVTACQCRPCEAGQTCEADGHCVDDGCAGVTCPTGTHCAMGTCRDSCEAGPDARLCPNGEMCELGECVPTRRGGSDGGTSVPLGDGGLVNPGGDGGGVVTPGSDGGVVTPNRDGGAAGMTDLGPRVFEFGTRSGCQCSTPNGRTPRGGAAAFFGLALGLAVTRRRRRAR